MPSMWRVSRARRGRSRGALAFPLPVKRGEGGERRSREPGEGHGRILGKPLTRLAFARHPLPAARGEGTRRSLIASSLNSANRRASVDLPPPVLRNTATFFMAAHASRG